MKLIFVFPAFNSSVSVSRASGRTTERNLICSAATKSPRTGRRARPRRTDQSICTTPGRIGMPGKWPAKYSRSGGTRSSSSTPPGPARSARISGSRRVIARAFRGVFLREERGERLRAQLAALVRRKTLRKPPVPGDDDPVEALEQARAQRGDELPAAPLAQARGLAQHHDRAELLLAAGKRHDRRVEHPRMLAQPLLALGQRDALALDLGHPVEPPLEIEPAAGEQPGPAAHRGPVAVGQ